MTTVNDTPVWLEAISYLYLPRELFVQLEQNSEQLERTLQ